MLNKLSGNLGPKKQLFHFADWIGDLIKSIATGEKGDTLLA
jgi:hypothetical protein